MIAVDYDPTLDKSYRDTALGGEVVAWLDWLELGGAAERTIDTYERDLSVLCHLYPTKGLQDLSDLQLGAAIKRFPVASRRVRAAAFASFFKWATRTAEGSLSAFGDPKPPPRFQATTKQWIELRKQKLGPCRLCGRVPTTLHHLVPRSLRGSDVPENLVPLCGSGVHGCHGAVEAKKPDAISALRKNLRVEEVQYIIDTKGSDFLYRYYPHVCEDCGESIINFGAHAEACRGR